MEGASGLFLRYGIRSVSMDNIASHLGMSKKTIYQYFRDKDEIVYSVTEAHVQGERQQFGEIASKSKNAIEELVGLSGCLRENLKGMNPSLLFDLQKYHHRAWKIWLDFKDHFIRDQIERSIEQGKEEGYFRPQVNTKVLAIMRLETIQMAFDPTLFPKEEYSLSQVQVEIFDHYIHGLFTEKGKKLYEKYKQEFPKKENTIT